MLNKLSLRNKLFLLSAFFLIFSFAIGGVSYLQLTEVVGDYDKVADLSVPKQRLAFEMSLSFRQLRIHLRTLGLRDISNAEAKAAIESVHSDIAKFESLLAQFEKYPAADGQLEHVRKVEAGWADFKILGAEVLDLQKTGTPEALSKVSSIFLHQCPEKAGAFTLTMGDFVGFLSKTLDKRVQKARAAARLSNEIILVMLIVVLMIGLGFGWLISKGISGSLTDVIQQLGKSAHAVLKDSAQIASTSNELALATTAQSSELIQTATAIDEISAMVQKNAHHSRQAAESSECSRELAEQGTLKVKKLKDSISEIRISNRSIMAQVNESNKQMSEIVSVIQNISAKTRLINDIVFQTKLLSFNASVEAARAGEQGKGFSVVAEEVGKLAQVSGQAALEISEILKSGTENVQKIVAETKSQVESLISIGQIKVDAGESAANDCTELLNEMLKNVTVAASMVSEISIASHEQSQGVIEVTRAINQIKTGNQSNSLAGVQTAEAAKSLSSQATHVNQAVARLELIVKGAA